MIFKGNYPGGCNNQGFLYITNKCAVLNRKSTFADNFLKARKKLKETESESKKITEEDDHPPKIRRRISKRFSFSTDEEDDSKYSFHFKNSKIA